MVGLRAFYDKLLTWDDAQAYCKERGGQLAVMNFRSKIEDARRIKCGSSLWVGGKLSNNEWRWAGYEGGAGFVSYMHPNWNNDGFIVIKPDGGKLRLNKIWQSSAVREGTVEHFELALGAPDQDCMIMGLGGPQDMFFQDASCSQKLPFVCEGLVFEDRVALPPPADSNETVPERLVQSSLLTDESVVVDECIPPEEVLARTYSPQEKLKDDIKMYPTEMLANFSLNLLCFGSVIGRVTFGTILLISVDCLLSSEPDTCGMFYLLPHHHYHHRRCHHRYHRRPLSPTHVLLQDEAKC